MAEQLLDDELDELPEPPEFDYKEHDLLHSVQIEELLLEIYEVAEGYRWELVDRYGRTHNSNDGFETDAHALRDGLNFSLKKGATQAISEDLAVELQELRDVIPHAAQVGARQTNISIEMLTVLLAGYDSTQTL